MRVEPCWHRSATRYLGGMTDSGWAVRAACVYVRYRVPASRFVGSELGSVGRVGAGQAGHSPHAQHPCALVVDLRLPYTNTAPQDCLSMREVGDSTEGFPPGTELIPGPRVQRQVRGPGEGGTGQGRARPQEEGMQT